MQVYNDFRNVKAGEVYVRESKIFSGGHAIRCIGYGVIDDAPANAPVEETMYWECINSWGPRFADKGIFKIRMDQAIGYRAAYNDWVPESSQMVSE